MRLSDEDDALLEALAAGLDMTKGHALKMGLWLLASFARKLIAREPKADGIQPPDHFNPFGEGLLVRRGFGLAGRKESKQEATTRRLETN